MRGPELYGLLALVLAACNAAVEDAVPDAGSGGSGGERFDGAAGTAGRSGGGAAGAPDSTWTNGIPPLHTEGRYFKDPAGNTVILRGVAVADPLDVDGRESALHMEDLLTLLSDPQRGFYARVVRITVLPDFWLQDPDTHFTQHLQPAVEHATSRGLYVIIDWHEIADVATVADRTGEFWRFMAPQYASYTNVLYEIFNEPVDADDPSWARWKQYAQPWVDEIRQSAPDNVILIGGPFWDQQIGGAASDPFVGDNLAYVGHVYPVSASDMLYDASPIAEAAAARPVMVTEWGYRDADSDIWGGTQTSFGDPLRAFVETHGLGWTAWCADTLWEPVMFDADWNLLTGEGNMGGFVRDWLAERRDEDQPAGR
jgi:endoglucanase